MWLSWIHHLFMLWGEVPRWKATRQKIDRCEGKMPPKFFPHLKPFVISHSCIISFIVCFCRLCLWFVVSCIRQHSWREHHLCKMTTSVCSCPTTAWWNWLKPLSHHLQLNKVHLCSPTDKQGFNNTGFMLPLSYATTLLALLPKWNM